MFSGQLHLCLGSSLRLRVTLTQCRDFLNGMNKTSHSDSLCWVSSASFTGQDPETQDAEAWPAWRTPWWWLPPQHPAPPPRSWTSTWHGLQEEQSHHGHILHSCHHNCQQHLVLKTRSCRSLTTVSQVFVIVQKWSKNVAQLGQRQRQGVKCILKVWHLELLWNYDLEGLKIPPQKKTNKNKTKQKKQHFLKVKKQTKKNTHTKMNIS